MSLRASVPFLVAFASAAAHAGGPPPVALLVHVPGEPSTRVVVARADGASTEWGSFAHEPHAVVKGRVLPGARTVVAVADRDPRGDGSFGAHLMRIAPQQPVRTLVDRVVHASRPLVTRDGRIFVERGAAGPPPADAVGESRGRVDELTVDEVDPETGAARTVLRGRGFALHLAGTYRDELIVLRIGPVGTEVIAVHPDTGATRSVTGFLPSPIARDVSVDEQRGTIVYATVDPSTRTWLAVERSVVAPGEIRVLERSRRPALLPHVWPEGRVVFSPDGERGLCRVGAAECWSPLGPGADRVWAFSADGAWAALHHTLPSTLPVPFVLSTDGRRHHLLPVPTGARAEIAGFIEEAAR